MREPFCRQLRAARRSRLRGDPEEARVSPEKKKEAKKAKKKKKKKKRKRRVDGSCPVRFEEPKFIGIAHKICPIYQRTKATSYSWRKLPSSHHVYE